MKRLIRVGAVVLALVAIVALIPVFVTLDDYVPTLEKELSAKLDRPVSIDKLNASVYPVPHATLQGITIGEQDEIEVSTVRVKPDLWSLFGSSKVIRELVFEDVMLTSDALAGLAALTQRDGGAGGGLRLENISLRNATVKLERGRFGPFDADVKVSGPEGPGEFTLRMRDDALKIRLTPEGERFRIDLQAKGWTSPVGPPIRFEALSVQGVATRTQADLGRVSARLYGGTVDGRVLIDWDKGIGLKGELVVQGVELRDAAALFAKGTRVSGRLNAKPVFSAQAKSVSGLDENLRIESPFTVHTGVLYGLDLAQAASVFLNQQSDNAQTHFDELTGRLLHAQGNYRFSDLRIASGALSARGSVSVSQAKALSGELNTSLKAAGMKASIPLIVAGTLDSPSVYPNPRALAGAAAGTALLGPGVGTAAGAKIGEMLEGLLGGKKAQR